jgi:hypothetical protein
MKLPDATPVSAEALAAIATRHRLRFDGAERMDPPGITNTVYALRDEYVLRVLREHDAHAEQARTEAAQYRRRAPPVCARRRWSHSTTGATSSPSRTWWWSGSAAAASRPEPRPRRVRPGVARADPPLRAPARRPLAGGGGAGLDE